MFVSCEVFQLVEHLAQSPPTHLPTADAFPNFAGKSWTRWEGGLGWGVGGYWLMHKKGLAHQLQLIFSPLCVCCAFLCTPELNYTDVSFMKPVQLCAFHHNVPSQDAAHSRTALIYGLERSPLSGV